MSHYVCRGNCATSSDQPGVCQTEDCMNKGMPYEDCICEDGEHEKVEN